MTARLHSLRHQEKKSPAGSGSGSGTGSHRQQQQQGPNQGASPAASPSPSPSLSPSPSPKHSDGRRANKPLMEKRRRARINQSLAALKALILDSARLENTKHSKLEKADILELTVRHLQRQRSLAQPGLSRYKAGYQDCSREVSRYLEAPDIITGNATPMDPGVKQRLLRHLDSCVSELDLDLGSRPDSGLGSSPGSVTDRVPGTVSPTPLDPRVPPTPTAHCSSALASMAIIKSEIADLESTRPDSSTTAGDENNNSSRPASAFGQPNHPVILDSHNSSNLSLLDPQASTSQQSPNMLSVVQVIPSRLPDGQVVFLLPSHYVQLAAAAAANGISIGPNPPTAIWAATNMSLLKATDKLAKRSHDEIQEWQDPATTAAAAAAAAAAVVTAASTAVTAGTPSITFKSNKLLRPTEHAEQPLDFTTNSKKLKTSVKSSVHGVTALEHQLQQQQQHHHHHHHHHHHPQQQQQHQQQQQQQQEQEQGLTQPESTVTRVSAEAFAGPESNSCRVTSLERRPELSSSSPTITVGSVIPSPAVVSSPFEQRPAKDEEGMWRPW